MAMALPAYRPMDMNNGRVSIERGMLRTMESKVVWAGSEQYRWYRGEIIIQRDGKPFFWPEREAV
jgi:hypothetical protein